MRRGGPRHDRDVCETNLDANLERLSEALRNGTYRPQAIRRHYIPKPGSQEKRPLGIPTVQDRVVQTALRKVMEPIFERDFAAQATAFAPAGGARTRCGGWMSCSRRATSMWWTRT